MSGYRTIRRKTRAKSFLGRSFLISILLNLLFLFAFSQILSFNIFDLPKEDEIMLVTIVEIPAIQNPSTKKPEIIKEEPIAEVSVKPKVEPILPEPAKVQEIETKPIVKREEVLAEGSPKVEIKMPEIELPAQEEIASQPKETSARQDVQVAVGSLKPSISSRKEIGGEVLEEGEFEIEAKLGQENRERVESTYGEVVTPGVISALPEVKEKESPFGNRPLAIMVENAKDARPQSGLDRANIVYEVLTEGGITRFLAIYASQEADKVGPVRSARPYFITKALEHQSIYIHAGESPDAGTFIKEEHIDDINELNQFQPFWRIQERKPPHNLYTSTWQLRDEAKKMGYIEMINKEDYQFEIDQNEVLTGKEIQQLDIQYNVNYAVSYRYNPETQKYIRLMNGEPHLDAETGKPIEVKNIIIQHTEKKVMDEEGRLSVDFLGEGEGLIIFNGRSEEITWVKEDLNSRTLFYNDDGNRLAIQPGNVWIQVVHPDTIVDY
ncbi:MAG: DUF3048 domain-containing protein [Candidatus Atribacteria bacterium]|nr:DUF3048 domain-containing protein [Candidatus Atribacteria bacterium]